MYNCTFGYVIYDPSERNKEQILNMLHVSVHAFGALAAGGGPSLDS